MPKQRSRVAIPRALRSVEAAAVAGLAYSALTLVAGALLTRAPEPNEGDDAVADWYLQESNQRSVLVAVNLLTVGVIAFVWFVAVIRRRVGMKENRFFGTVFLGSALLVSAAWLIGGMLLAAPALSAYLFNVAPDASDAALTRAGASTMLSIVAARLEAVFVVSTTTVGRLSDAFPRWLIVLGYVLGLTLLLVPVPNSALTWLFPGWVAVTSAVLLVRRDALDGHQAGRAAGPAA
ncbi:MAG: hypothetical protein ACR2PK_11855 [Acidimicrobiales bacterium]